MRGNLFDKTITQKCRQNDQSHKWPKIQQCANCSLHTKTVLVRHNQGNVFIAIFRHRVQIVSLGQYYIWVIAPLDSCWCCYCLISWIEAEYNCSLCFHHKYVDTAQGS